MSAGQLPPPGTVLRKVDKHGVVRCEAVVGQNGQVVYRGVTYSSISAAAKAASGDIGLAARSCDGYAFFGLKNRGEAPVIGNAASALPLPLPVRWDDLPSPPQENTLSDWAAIIMPERGSSPVHSEHGRADASGVPYDPDCPCRAGALEVACAEAGCGFCRAARMVAASLPEDQAVAAALLQPLPQFPQLGTDGEDDLEDGATPPITPNSALALSGTRRSQRRLRRPCRWLPPTRSGTDGIATGSDARIAARRTGWEAHAQGPRLSRLRQPCSARSIWCGRSTTWPVLAGPRPSARIADRFRLRTRCRQN